MHDVRLVLASASPRRAELLAAAGFAFETLIVDVDETPRPDEAADLYVRRLAAEKSARAQALIAAGELRGDRADGDPSRTRSIILGADTTVVVDGAILAKPDDDDHAREMLRRLSARTHEVLTGISLRQGAYEVGRVEATTVTFSAMSDADIEWYVATGEGRDKAGAYAIQGHASRFIPRIDGSYSNVVGLPVSAVHELLTELQNGL